MWTRRIQIFFGHLLHIWMHVIQHLDKSQKTPRHSLFSIQISFTVLNPIYLFTLLLLKLSFLECPRTYRPCACVLYLAYNLSCLQSANPSEDCSKKNSALFFFYLLSVEEVESYKKYWDFPASAFVAFFVFSYIVSFFAFTWISFSFPKLPFNQT